MPIGAQAEPQRQSGRNDGAANEVHTDTFDLNANAEEPVTAQSSADDEDVVLWQLKKIRNDFHKTTYIIFKKIRQLRLLVEVTLNPYHVECLKWLPSLFSSTLRGVLAGGMRLGVTFQTPPLTAHLTMMKQINVLFIITVSLSVMSS